MDYCIKIIMMNSLCEFFKKFLSYHNLISPYN